MLTKNERNSIKALRHRENRKLEKRMVVEGNKGVEELLNSRFETLQIYATSSVEIHVIRVLAEEKGLVIIDVSSKDMQIMSSLKSAPGVLAVGVIKESDASTVVEKMRRKDNQCIGTILILDDLADPGNVGTLIRTADWFGLSGVICSPKTVDVWNAKTIQSSMGSIFKIPICIADPVEVLKAFNLKTVSLDTNGENLYNSDFSPEAFVVGSESHGVSEDLAKACNKSWAIPRRGITESLNAAIAGAIVTAELARRSSIK
ncbi:MAG: RNA methyltransferase [Flavobacteriales bacterium]|jgi:TrmH family RNA methyltransferase|tara:strand:- start:1080 stop:1859 length:780 start_codon:yes stop_codon:yes gene_type:complete